MTMYFDSDKYQDTMSKIITPTLYLRKEIYHYYSCVDLEVERETDVPEDELIHPQILTNQRTMRM